MSNRLINSVYSFDEQCEVCACVLQKTDLILLVKSKFKPKQHFYLTHVWTSMGKMDNIEVLSKLYEEIFYFLQR